MKRQAEGFHMVQIADTTTPVVVIQFARALAHGGLGVMRSLGRLGIPVYAVNNDEKAPAFASRYCQGRFLGDLNFECPEKSAKYLLEVGRKIGRRCILIPSTDDAAVFAAEHAQLLRERFIFPEQSPVLVRSLTSKKEMFYLAKRLGIPTAETSFPQSREDVLRFAAQTAFPIMLKGIDGVLLQNRGRKKMVIVRTQQELIENYDAMEDPGNPNLMLQEYIPGGDDTIWMFNGYFDKHSDCLLGFTGRKLRQFPVYTGATSLGICLENEAVAKTTIDFMKTVGYRGMLDIGYRYDARDGRYKVLDVNPRMGGTFRLFVAQNGMDVVRAMYLDMTGQPVPAARMVQGRKWIVEDSDFVSCLRYRKDGKLTLKTWIKSLRGVQEGAFFARDDLRPFLVLCAKNIRTIVHRGVQKARGLRRPAQSLQERSGIARISPVKTCIDQSKPTQSREVFQNERHPGRADTNLHAQTVQPADSPRP